MRYQSARDAAESMIHQTADQASGLVGEAARAAREAGDNAGRMASDAYDVGRSTARAVGRRMEDHPMLTLLVGIGVGWLVTRLLARR